MRMLTRRLLDGPSLDYEVATTPSPLQASPADKTEPLSTAEIIVVASNQKPATVNLASVTIAFDIAPAADPDDDTYLTSIGTGIDFAVMGDPDQQVWTLSDDKAGTLTATAKAGSVPIAGEGLTLIISNVQPNRGVGTFKLTVTETLLGGSANDADLMVSKFPAEFTLGNFRADAATVPQGGSTTLRWDGGVGATLTIFYPGGSADVTGRNSWPPPDSPTPMALTQDTEFVLEASVGTVALASFALTVEVVNQILDLTSLTVEKATALIGGATVGTAAANAGLTVNGAASVTAGMTVTGNMTVTAAPPATQYASALDVQNGWTRIGSFNTGPTKAIAQPSTFGGMAVGWNWSNGLAETNLYNVYCNAQQSFVFSQVTNTGKVDLLAISGTGDLTVTGGIQIGNWVIGVDANGDLTFTNGSTLFSLDVAGNAVASGTITAAGRRVVSHGDVVHLSNDQGFLNGTTRQGGQGQGWNAAAYWQDWNPPDGDGDINIWFVRTA